MGNIVAIVGRPNVGKSTFFNRITGSRKAIVDEMSGVTRDRHYGKSEWNGIEFSLIDTGGYVFDSDDIFEEEIRKQVLLAISEASVILFMVDILNGVTDLDFAIAEILRKSPKRKLLVANKADNNQRLMELAEFYSLGLGDIYAISSINGSGTGDLLDEVVKSFPVTEEVTEDILPKIAIVGRPNAGKSSLLNALVGEERNIVTPIPGTTRDSINTRYSKFGFDFYLIDTAGLRKKGKVHEDVEFYSVMRAIRSIEEADVCMLMIDAERGFEAQDQNIFSLIQKNKKGVVILVNKWDLIEKETHSTQAFSKLIKEKISPFNDVPILFISALTKQRIFKALETTIEVYNNRKQKLDAEKLDELMLEAIEAFHPPAVKGKYIHIRHVVQVPTPTPVFVAITNLPQYVREPYKRYLENKLREHFNFSGVPIQIFFRRKVNG